MLRVWLIKFIREHFSELYGIIRFGSKSCEMIAEEIKVGFEKKFGKRKVKIIISEDTIQGGVLE
jgi:CRISPR/Cas system-associated protein Cas5 (RAMP superfamily)